MLFGELEVETVAKAKFDGGEGVRLAHGVHLLQCFMREVEIARERTSGKDEVTPVDIGISILGRTSVDQTFFLKKISKSRLVTVIKLPRNQKVINLGSMWFHTRCYNE